MFTKIVATALLTSTVIAACAINARAATTDGTPVPTNYIDVLRSCGGKWKARDDKSVKGTEAWQTFRAECVKESGYVARGKKPR